MIAILLEFTFTSPVSTVFTILMWESSQSQGKDILWSTGENESRENIDGITGLRDITEIMLKMILALYQTTKF